MARHGEEIVEALPERHHDIRETDLANVQADWTIDRAIDDVNVSHAHASRCDRGTHFMTRGRIVLEYDDTSAPFSFLHDCVQFCRAAT